MSGLSAGGEHGAVVDEGSPGGDPRENGVGHRRGNGLGRAIALGLAAAGARVVLVGRTRSTLESVASEITVLGGSAHLAVADTSDPTAVDSLRTGLVSEDVSILVNNAGIAGPVAPLTEVDVDDWD